MKKIAYLIIGAMLFVGISKLHAQSSLSAAFAKSYEYEAKQNYNEAAKVIKEVYDKGSYESNLRLGWLYYKGGMYKESLLYYKIATELMPYSVEAKLGYVYPASALGNTNELITQYTKILEIDPQNTTANYWMGIIHYNKKEYALAFKYFEKIVNLYPVNYEGLLMFGWVNLRLGKTREAKILFNKVMLLYPSDKSALEGLELIK
ncbi:MAG: tetratricopeptide repeat protein [Bacteroidota bacterium]